MSAGGKICKCYHLLGEEEFVDCANTGFLALHYLTRSCLEPCHKSFTCDICHSMTGKSDQSVIDTNAQLRMGKIREGVCFWLIPKLDFFFNLGDFEDYI